jgi:hypothetical protein
MSAPSRIPLARYALLRLMAVRTKPICPTCASAALDVDFDRVCGAMQDLAVREELRMRAGACGDCGKQQHVIWPAQPEPPPVLAERSEIGARPMDDEPALRQKARAKIDRVQIPRRTPRRIWAGASSGILTCAICDKPVFGADLAVTLVFDRTVGGVHGDVYHVHTRCQAAWEFERGA